MILSNGDKYIFGAETGLTYYDISGNGNDLTVNLNGSSDGDQWGLLVNKDYHHNLKYGYYNSGDGVKVPGDPNNKYKDVNGIAISNKAEVIKYNRINAYLRKWK